MDYKYGHHDHRRDRSDDDQEGYPPPSFGHSAPPPPFGQPPPSSSYFGEDEPPRRPPQGAVYHTSHFGVEDEPPSRPPQGAVYHTSHFGNEDEPPPRPPQGAVYHTSHFGGEEESYGGDGYRRPPPAPQPDRSDYSYPESNVLHESHNYVPRSVHYQTNQGYQAPQPTDSDYSYSDSYQRPAPASQYTGSDFDYSESNVKHESQHVPSSFKINQSTASYDNKPTFKVVCKADTAYSLTIRDGQLILAGSDPDDECQYWIKDEKYSIRVKDEDGFPSFALVNRATGQALKHAASATYPVELVPYDADTLDTTVLWTTSKDLGDGFRGIRTVKNIRLHLDAFHGDQRSGGVRDGTTIVLWDWNKGDNQRWKIIPCCKSKNMRVFYKALLAGFFPP